VERQPSTISVLSRSITIMLLFHPCLSIVPLSFLALIRIMLKFEIKLWLCSSGGTFSNTGLVPVQIVQQPVSLKIPWERHYTHTHTHTHTHTQIYIYIYIHTHTHTLNYKSCSIVWQSVQGPPHIRPTWVTKSRRMRWASHLAHIEGMEVAKKILAGKN